MLISWPLVWAFLPLPYDNYVIGAYITAGGTSVASLFPSVLLNIPRRRPWLWQCLVFAGCWFLACSEVRGRSVLGRTDHDRSGTSGSVEGFRRSLATRKDGAIACAFVSACLFAVLKRTRAATGSTPSTCPWPGQSSACSC